MFKYVYVVTCLAWLISFYYYANNIVARKFMSAIFLLTCLAVLWVVWDIIVRNLNPEVLKDFKKRRPR